MAKKLSKNSKREVLEALKVKYGSASKQGKTLILDELVHLFTCHRKHELRLLIKTGENEWAGC